MESLKAKKVKCGSVTEERWGSLTTIYLLPEAEGRALPAQTSDCDWALGSVSV